MRLEFTVVHRDGRSQDVVATASPATTLRITFAGFLPEPDTAVYRGSASLDLDASVGSGALRNGDRITIGRPEPAAGWPLTGATLAIAGGAAAGTFVGIPTGKCIIGRSSPAEVLIQDPSVSSNHAVAELRADGSLDVTDSGSTNGTFLDGQRLVPGTPAKVSVGQRIVFGQSVCILMARTSPNGVVESGEQGARLFNRVLSYRASRPDLRFTLPTDPATQSSRTSNVAQYAGAAAMLVAGIGASLIYGNPLLALLGVLGPVALIGVTVSAHRGSRRQQHKEQAEFVAARTIATSEISAATDADAEYQWQASIDPATSVLAAIGPTSTLWSADAADPEFTVRLGTHDAPAHVTVQSAGSETVSSPMLIATPVAIDLRATSVLGIAGDADRSTAAARALVHQLVTARSPDDLLVYHLSADTESAAWSWLRWLPHVRGLDDNTHTVAPGPPEALKARLSELTSLIDHRGKLSQFGLSQQIPLPEVLVVLDGAGALRSRGSVVKVLNDGPAVGVRVVAVDRFAERLPAEATARFVIDPEGTGALVATLERQNLSTISTITPDLLAFDIADRDARALASLRPLGSRDSSELPESIRFADIIGLDRLRVADVNQRWASGEEGQSVLGIDEHGNVTSIDLVRDGPHALVAGTSGSGKSELLRTLLAGLALSSHPEDLSMLLIDFKGGGAFGKLEKLPHVVGYADDLMIGGRLADRLLDSLTAELNFRKLHFKDAGNVEGLPEYRVSRSRDPHLPAISRLVLVVDEFAELKEAQPDFVDGLVNIARVGRSLGVHLILATQQPAGVVTPQIRDNSNLRICLRVLDPSTSLDLVGTPVAATFSNRVKGRAVVLSGDSQATVLQTAYLTAPVRHPQRDILPPPKIQDVAWADCGLNRDAGTRAEVNRDPETDLSQLVTLLSSAAAAAGAQPARRPWRQPLPDRVLLSDITRIPPQPGRAPFSLEDFPARQRQPAGVFTIGGGNLGVAGGRGSGRSTALRTLAVSLATLHSADDVHLYVIDHTPTATLRPLLQLPHCGVVATRTERHKTNRLAARLSELVDARAAQLVTAGVPTFSELRAADPDAPPHVVVLIDGWDSIAQADDTAYRTLLRVAEDGPSVGVQLVICGASAMRDKRLRQHLADLLCLRFEQRDDLAEFDVPVRRIPDEQPPGRAYRPRSADAVQVALLSADPAPEAQNDAIRLAADTLAPARLHPPFRLDDLPARIGLTEAIRLPGAERSGLSVVVGVGGDELAARSVNLRRVGNPFLVIGAPGTGRTTALACITRQLVDAGRKVIVVPADQEERTRFDGAALTEVQPDGAAPANTVIVIDDAGRLPDTNEFVRSALTEPSSTVIMSGNAAGLSGWGGWKSALSTSNAGLLLSPQFGDGAAIGAKIELAQAFSGAPGRGYLSIRGSLELIQVPLS